MKTAVLFVIYHRPAIAQASFERIRAARPERLYIAADGADPTVADDDESVELTRRTVFDMIDWECELHTLLHPTHLGCGPGMLEAINWFFNHEEQGIIIEEDCVASTSCFPFMERMLRTYAREERIGMVSGTNPVADKFHSPASWCFSNYKTCWGWATWRRAWEQMDATMTWRAHSENTVLASHGIPGREVAEGRFRLREIDRRHVSTWDWEWIFSLALHNQLCIYPAVNLVTNIGDDSRATHTALGGVRFNSGDLEDVLSPPDGIRVNNEFELLMHRHINTLRRRIQRHLPYRMRRCAKKSLLALRNCLKQFQH